MASGLLDILYFLFIVDIGSSVLPGSNMAASATLTQVSDTRVVAVVVRNFPFHLFDVTGCIHLFRSLT